MSLQILVDLQVVFFKLSCEQTRLAAGNAASADELAEPAISGDAMLRFAVYGLVRSVFPRWLGPSAAAMKYDGLNQVRPSGPDWNREGRPGVANYFLVFGVQARTPTTSSMHMDKK